MDAKAFQQIILKVYETAQQPELWPEVLDQLTQMLNARGSLIFEWQPHANGRVLAAPYFTSGYDSAKIEDYIHDFSNRESADQDLFERQSLRFDGIELVGEHDLFENEEEYISQPHVSAMLEFGIRHRYGCLLDKDNPLHGRFTIQRSRRQGVFSTDELEALTQILPHLAKAHGLGQQLAETRAIKGSLLSAFERLSVGVGLVDADARLVEKNTLFQHHCATFPSLCQMPDGRISFLEPAKREVFFRLLASALNHGQFGARPRKEAIMLGGTDNDGYLCVDILPLSRVPELGTRPFDGVILVTRDTTQPIKINLDLARQVYGFTAAELEVLASVCEGLTNAEIAQRKLRSPETVKTHMAAIMSKASVKNRTELVRLLCSFLTSERCI